MACADQSPQYWREYSNLQHVKHAVIRNYLNGWFPKLTLGTWGEDRVLYIDTHSGRGQHLRGQLGSPLVALKTLLEHKFRDKFLERSVINFLFIERDRENVDQLADELDSLHPLPENIRVFHECGDSFEVINDTLDSFETGEHLAPSFIFVDPYGFKVPGSLLRRLMMHRKVELFVNVIWRELDMAIQQGDSMPPGMRETLDSVFDGDRWRNIDSEDSDERAEQCVNEFRDMTAAVWATFIRMLGENGKTRYMLLHLTNHAAGRDLMKECVWSACPDGGYYARKTDDPRQQMLIGIDPDLTSLCDWVINRLANGPKRWKDLEEQLRSELWLKKHLRSVVGELRREKVLSASDYMGRFAPKNSPLLSLSDK